MRKKKKGQKRYNGFLSFALDRFPFCQFCGNTVLPEDNTIKRPRNMVASTDHLIPRSKGGGDDWSNLVISCKECNENFMDAYPKPIIFGPNCWQEVKRKEDLKRKNKKLPYLKKIDLDP